VESGEKRWEMVKMRGSGVVASSVCHKGAGKTERVRKEKAANDS